FFVFADELRRRKAAREYNLLGSIQLGLKLVVQLRQGRGKFSSLLDGLKVLYFAAIQIFLGKYPSFVFVLRNAVNAVRCCNVTLGNADVFFGKQNGVIGLGKLVI